MKGYDDNFDQKISFLKDLKDVFLKYPGSILYFDSSKELIRNFPNFDIIFDVEKLRLSYEEGLFFSDKENDKYKIDYVMLNHAIHNYEMLLRRELEYTKYYEDNKIEILNDSIEFLQARRDELLCDLKKMQDENSKLRKELEKKGER